MRRGAGGQATVNGKRQSLKADDNALQPIGLHEARHTFASLMIAAGVNPKALSTFMGHASIQITIDRYGHLMPGGRDEARAAIDAYLDRLGNPGANREPLGVSRDRWSRKSLGERRPSAQRRERRGTAVPESRVA